MPAGVYDRSHLRSWVRYRPKPKAWTLERLRELSEQEPNTGCWLWTGSVNRGGYGFASIAHKTVYAHRIAYWLGTGEMPPAGHQGLQVMHRCDNPPCVNPDHLRLGTAKDNCDDKWAKGRDGRDRWAISPEGKQTLSAKSRGVNNPEAKLDEAKVRAIRAEYAATGVQRPLCAKYGVTPMTINAIVHRRSWKHVD